eukprot:7217411-Pyramimonas_sp.AAC.2
MIGRYVLVIGILLVENKRLLVKAFQARIRHLVQSCARKAPNSVLDLTCEANREANWYLDVICVNKLRMTEQYVEA